MEWRWEDGSVTRLGKGAHGVLHVDSRAAEERRIAYRLTAPHMEHRADNEGTSGEVRDVELTLRGLPTEELSANAFDWALRGKQLRVAKGSTELRAETLIGSGKLNDVLPAPDASSVSIDLQGAALVRASSRGDFALEASLVERERAAAGYQGKVAAAGDDASVFLAAAELEQLPSWLRSKFEGEPFRFEATAVIVDDTLSLHRIRLERGAMSVRGFWHLGDHHRDGALLMQYGGMYIGVEAVPQGLSVGPVGQDWLAAKSTSD